MKSRFSKISRIVLSVSLLTSIIFCELLADFSKPNFIILYADDMGYGDLAIQNPESKIPTPNLDKLAREGMRFTDGHSSSGICTPSRYALLTGRHHWRKFHGIVNSFGSSVFDEDELTLPEMLKQSGYKTAQIGKWHLGFDWNALVKPGTKLPKGKKNVPADAMDWSKKIPDGPTAHGFDYSFTDAVINFPPYTWIENDRVVTAPDRQMNTNDWKPIKEGRWECRSGPMASNWDPYENIPTLTEKAVSYIRKQADSDEPFFLYFAYPSPHAPIIPNDEFDGKSEAGPYGDFVFETDDSCGQILAAVEAAGLSENTVVFFTADNGSEKYMMARYLKYGHNSSGPFRGMKRDIYEGGHHVPFIVKWPGVTKPGSVSDALVSQVDIMPTIADSLGFQMPEGKAEDGFNMMPILEGDKDVLRDTLVYNTNSKNFGLRQGDWVYLQNASLPHGDYQKANNFPKESNRKAIFNLKEDIGQRNNLIEQYPEKAEQMEKLLQDIRKKGYTRSNS